MNKIDCSLKREVRLVTMPSEFRLAEKINKCKLLPITNSLEINKLEFDAENVEEELLRGKTLEDKEATRKTLKYKCARTKALNITSYNNSIGDNYIE